MASTLSGRAAFTMPANICRSAIPPLARSNSQAVSPFCPSRVVTSRAAVSTAARIVRATLLGIPLGRPLPGPGKLPNLGSLTLLTVSLTASILQFFAPLEFIRKPKTAPISFHAWPALSSNSYASPKTRSPIFTLVLPYHPPHFYQKNNKMYWDPQ